jgi:hypothetical protein
MRVAIRLLTATTFVLFVVAIAVEQRGEQVRATSPARNFPGLLEGLVALVLLALSMLLFGIASVLGVIMAIRTKERPWVIVMTLSVTGIALIYLREFLPHGFSLSVIQPFLPQSVLLRTLMVFTPALLGSLFLAIYSFHTPRDLRPPLYTRLGG